MTNKRNYFRKSLITLSAMILFIAVGFMPAKAQNGRVSFQLFYDELSPYGEWVDDPEYGYMWLPDVDRNFQPYGTNGRWVNTEYGNTWYSDYDWGWAPFHYGRWHYDDYYGWAWVPGYEWGPAWVSWRQSSGYYGWAPLSPGLSMGININIPVRFWVFVPSRYILSPRIYRYYSPYANRARIYNQTTIIHNTYVYNNNRYYSGPDRRSLERSTRGRVDVHQIRNSNRPGRGSIDSRSVALYRPSISREGNKNARPSRVADSKSIRNSRGNNSSSSAVSRPSRGNASNNSETRTSSPRNTTRSTNSQDKNQSVRPSRSTNGNASSNNNTRSSAQPRATNERTGRQSRSTDAARQRESQPAGREAQRPSKPVQRQENQRTRPSQNARPDNHRENRSSSAAVRTQAVSTRSTPSSATKQRATQPQRSSRTSTSTRQHSVSRSSGGHSQTRQSKPATKSENTAQRSGRSSR